MKIAYIILSHKNPSQIMRLADLLATREATSIIAIHHDGTREFHPTPASARKIRFIEPTTRIEWGSYSLIEATLKGIRLIHHEEAGYDWLILLSGQDYPVTPLHEIERQLATSPYDGFLAHQPIDSAGSGFGERYYFRYIMLPKRLKTLCHRLQKKAALTSLLSFKAGPGTTRPRVGIRRFKTIFGPRLRCYKGSQWFTVSSKCVDYVLNFIDNNKDIQRYFEHTFIPDESFFHTILLNSELKIKNDNKRFILWDEKASHPKLLRTADLDAIVASGAHFARKFDDTVDSAILDEIDRKLLLP